MESLQHNVSILEDHVGLLRKARDAKGAQIEALTVREKRLEELLKVLRLRCLVFESFMRQILEEEGDSPKELMKDFLKLFSGSNDIEHLWGDDEKGYPPPINKEDW